MYARSDISLRLTWLCGGVVFGLVFPVFAVAFDNFFVRAAPLPIAQLMLENPVHLVVTLAPLVLGATFFVIGTFHTRLRSNMKKLHLAEREHWHLANRDALTGLGNRHKLMNDLAVRQDRFLILLDIDKFKFINDAHGHDTGDATLCALGARLVTALDDRPQIYRLGGDEFIIAFPVGASADHVCACAQRLLDELKAPLILGDRQIFVHSSLGIAPHFASDACPSDALRRADLAQYQAKKQDGSAFVLFEPRMAEVALQEKQIKLDLQTALDTGGLFVEFQPIHAVPTRELTGAETLVRWHHPQHGRIMPDTFIRIAEESGQIVPLGEFVLRAACHAARDWSEDLSVAVNVSVIQFRMTGFFDLVQDVLAETGLSANRLVLEITETVLIEDERQVNETIRKLQGLGARIALDDFGEGFTSVNHLLKLGLDKLKLDKSLTTQLIETPRIRAVVRSILDMCKALDIETTMEGVEVVEELHAIQALGIDQIQGYFFSPPLSKDHMLRYARAHTTSARTA